MIGAEQTSYHFSKQISCQESQNNSYILICHPSANFLSSALRVPARKRKIFQKKLEQNIYPLTGGSTPARVKSQSHSISRQTSRALSRELHSTNHSIIY